MLFRKQTVMPLALGLPPEAGPLHEEITELVRAHRADAGADSFFYNGFTAISLLAAGAASVLATRYPLIAASLSAVAAFFIAISRALNFGGRWLWHLQRQCDYSQLIYRLNEVGLVDPADQKDALRRVYASLIDQRPRDAGIPGSGEPAARGALAHDGGRAQDGDGDLPVPPPGPAPVGGAGSP